MLSDPDFQHSFSQSVSQPLVDSSMFAYCLAVEFACSYIIFTVLQNQEPHVNPLVAAGVAANQFSCRSTEYCGVLVKGFNLGTIVIVKRPHYLL